jgi:site-specific DNA recombinase
MNNSNNRTAMAKPKIRCAVYTRKSTEEGLEQEFNTLDAQRESGEAYIKSQAHEGWDCVSTRYDDGGYTGANMDRPALRRLLADIEAGKIDCVIVYKVDRLSRSLLDFARLIESFDKHHISFASVTQAFNTATSMGRLILNVLLSFAQFEREIISERTRDKIAATRRKGKWSGGHPILGYDVDPERFKLVVNEDEAARVRAIFELYLQHEGLIPVVQELARRGWCNKRWTTRKGRERGGKAFTKTNLHKLLTNVAYNGKIKYKTETHDGEHAAIVDPSIWQRVQDMLGRNGRTGGALVRNKFGAFLKGMLRCVPCGSAMTPAHTTKGNKRYRYYVCSSAQKRGWQTCPSKSIPAGAIERFVLDQIRCIGKDPELWHETFRQATALPQTGTAELLTEQRGLERDLTRWGAEIHHLLGAGAVHGSDLARLADLQERIRQGERRHADIQEQLVALEGEVVDEHEIALALSSFEPVWEALTPREHARIVELLIERVDYNGTTGKVAITFQPAGIRTLAAEITKQRKEIA